MIILGHIRTKYLHQNYASQVSVTKDLGYILLGSNYEKKLHNTFKPYLIGAVHGVFLWSVAPYNNNIITFNTYAYTHTVYHKIKASHKYVLFIFYNEFRGTKHCGSLITLVQFL